VVPSLQYSGMVRHQSIFTGGSLFGMSPNSTVPEDTAFVSGWAVNLSSAVCAGRGDSRVTPEWLRSSSSNNKSSSSRSNSNNNNDDDNDNVSLCQALAFNAGMGNLLSFSNELPLFNALTLPAILTSLGLPFRAYVMGLAAPAVGIVIMWLTQCVRVLSARACLLSTTG
jgi:hypothetical protein